MDYIHITAYYTNTLGMSHLKCSTEWVLQVYGWQASYVFNNSATARRSARHF